MGNMSRRERIIMFSAVLLMGLFIADKYVLSWVSRVSKELTDNIGVHETRLLKYKRILKQYHSVSKEMRAKVLSLEPAGSDQEEMTKLLKQIEFSARKTGVKILDIKPLPVKKKERYKSLEISLETESSWPRVIKFMDVIRKAPEPIKVSQLTLRRNRGPRPSLRARFVIDKIIIK